MIATWIILALVVALAVAAWYDFGGDDN